VKNSSRHLIVATRSKADCLRKMAALPRLPLCANLIRLDVHYRRWLRVAERTALIPVFSDIVASHNSEEHFGLFLQFDGPILCSTGEFRDL